jgi:hypothetical protein
VTEGRRIIAWCSAAGVSFAVSWVAANAALDALVSACHWPGVPDFACDPSLLPDAFEPTTVRPSEEEAL